MADKQTLEVHEKKELEAEKEKTVPGRFYVPSTDIYETEEALVVLMDVPGVGRESLEVNVEKDTLSVEGRIDSSKYENLEPVYSEYNVGHFSRSFSLSHAINSEGITATVADGVLTLTLPKAKEAAPRRIEVG